jgi:hypothetical protein
MAPETETRQNLGAEMFYEMRQHRRHGDTADEMIGLAALTGVSGP